MKTARIHFILPIFFFLILLLAVQPLTTNAATTGTITASVNHVDEGSIISLTTNMSGTVTWTSSNTSIATVSSTGKVIGKLAGQVTITASCSGYTDASITIWVTVPDGIYYIKNSSSGYCMQVSTESVYLFSKNTGTTGRIVQLWKIKHISKGNYVIRPLYNLSVALTINSSGIAVVADTLANDSLVPSSMYWKISHNSFGYAFKHTGLNSKTAMPVTNDSAGSQVQSGTWASSLTCHWSLESAHGIFLRDTTTLKTVSSSTTKYMSFDEQRSYSNFDLSYEYYGSLTNLSWNSSDNSIVRVTSGVLTGVQPGTAEITLSATLNGTTYTSSFKCTVTRTEAILLAINDDDGSDRHSYFENTATNLQTIVNSKSSMVISNCFDSLTVNDTIEYLQNYDYFIIHTHGAKTNFKIGPGIDLTMTNIANIDLTNLDFVLLLTCYTALDYDDSHISNNAPVNITEQLVLCGAETVIGFKDTTTVADCNKFANDLSDLLFVQKYSISAAIEYLNDSGSHANILGVIVVAGDSENTYR